MTNNFFSRTEYLIGSDGIDSLHNTRVILFGVGGVGSWCAEALIRTGISHLTIVDHDTVAPSNINRQLPATSATLGQPKVQIMRRRLLEINPQADIVARDERYCAETAESFPLADYDYVIDAIDSLADKALLIRMATAAPRTTTLFSSMGAARKLDPLQMRVSEFWQVKGCPLAAALRQKFKRSGQFPARKFKAVWSPEVRQNLINDAESNGSLVHITAIWGMTLASLVINHRINQNNRQ
ncbi:MAG: tRNA threonylcarbamoyladenosine dehydratase [Muribaculaceae bacterium]|nr:tRNA threonylcarbamoyladenosine dehydratase [Muribaculaceae bacterium]MDE6315176.1 tRNA threonylcarbamoyladenosine dehydratase [Muribaculaceae bacterium]